MADNSPRTPGTGEVDRSIEKTGVKTQVVGLDVGGTGPEKILSAAYPIPITGAIGQPIRVQNEMNFDSSSLTNPGTILFVEPRDNEAMLGAWNDGIGSASIDAEIPFNGRSSVRLEMQGKVASLASGEPGTSPLTTGVVWKRRLQFAVNGIYSVESWLRWTSVNNTSSTYTVMDHYNRDGTNAYLGRIWIDISQNPVQLKYLNAFGATGFTYTQFGTCQIAPATHMYGFDSGRLDKAGQWSFGRLVVDFTNKLYVGFQFNDIWFDLSGITIRTISSVGAQAMHYGLSYAATTSTRPRYMHASYLLGRRYS